MKIVHFIPHFGQGGDWVIVKMMAHESSSQGHEVGINGIDASASLARGLPLNPFPLNEGLRGFLISLRNLVRIAKDTDILHAHSPVCLLFSAVARVLRCRKSAILFTFHWPVPDHGMRHWLKRWIFNLADVIHVYSQETEAILSQRYGTGLDKVKRMYIGLNAGRFEPGFREKARVRLGIGPETRVIGYMGRLATEKNVRYLIRFFHEHHGEFSELELWIAGAGDLEVELKQAAANGSAAGKIHFLGYSREPEMIYPAFDLLVLPSDFEAFALVVVEAAYCGVPTLRSDVEGSRDQIQHGASGFVYPHSGGYGAMEKELLRILREEWRRLPEVGCAARVHCLELCEPKRFRAGLESLMAGAMQQAGRRAPSGNDPSRQ
jgi:glycosyltransferase involved in cell wall biosynthesis